MHRAPATSESGPINRLLLLAAAILVLMMPVEYRGGATVSHPHAILELVRDAAGGSLIHHGVPEAQAGRKTGDHALHTSNLGGRFWIPAAQHGDPVAQSDFVWTGLAPTSAAFAGAPPPQIDWNGIDRDNELPTISPLSTAGKHVAYAILLPGMMLLLTLWSHQLSMWRRAASLVGIYVTPEPPPPRTTATRHF